MQISRRQALKALVGVAAATTAPVAAAQILVPEEPRRRIWQVGKKLVRPTLAQISRQYERQHGDGEKSRHQNLTPNIPVDDFHQ